MFKRLVGLGLAGGTTATAVSYYDNGFNVDSMGVVRLGRAAFTVCSLFYRFTNFLPHLLLFQGLRVIVHYKTTLYAPSVNKSLPNYQEIRSKVSLNAINKQA